ncbi:hypothetical protein ACOMHN_025366 [Nucella lapillus]
MTTEDLQTQMTSLSMGEALRMCEKTTNIETIIALTHHPLPRVRKRALVEMCPCRVKDDLTDFWERVFAMIPDEDADVRYQVLHTLCDGSPRHLEYRVAEALDTLNRDANPKIRRKAHQCLTSYWRKGKWNIM